MSCEGIGTLPIAKQHHSESDGNNDNKLKDMDGPACNPNT